MSVVHNVQLFSDPPLWFKMLGQLFCLGGIELCCERQLARWIAHNEATPPKTITKKDGEPLKRGPRSCRARWEAYWSMVMSLSMIIVPGLALTGVLKKDDSISQYLVDGAWGCVVLHIFAGAFATALYNIFPRQRYIRKVRGRGDESKLWDFTITSGGSESGLRWANPLVNQCVGFGCSALLLGSNFLGRQDLVPLAAAAQVISVLSAGFAPNYRMSVMVYIQAGVMAVFLIAGGLVVGLSSDKPVDPSKDTTPSPSPWILNLMTLFSYTVANAIPGAFMMANMRYEYGRVASPRLPAAPSEPVLIDHHNKPPFLPLHHLSIYSFVVVYAIIDALHYFEIVTNHWLDLWLIILMAIPATVGGSALLTFFRGDFEDWWNYSENYRPKIDFGEVTELDEDGKAVNLDEKRPISP